MSAGDGKVHIPNKGMLDKMAILQQTHDIEIGMAGYNAEPKWFVIVKLFYLNERDDYEMESEDKVDHTVGEVIQQIHGRNYAQRFLGELGEQLKCKGHILVFGISYYMKDSTNT